MGSSSENNDNNNNIHAKGKSSVVVELLKGEQMAIQLQNLLHKNGDDDDVAPVSAHDLAQQIFTSFTDTLSALTTNKAGPVKHHRRRGSYKKRKSSDSWTTITPGMGDGYAWRKYGQKVILNSEYPRCYYRCTNKYEQGCKATKQVQKMSKENPVSYQTTYFIHHTCTGHHHHHHARIFTRAPPPIVGSDPVDHNSLTFQATSHSKEDDDDDDDYHCYSTNPMMMIKKEESKQESPVCVPGPARLSMDQWLDFIGPESFGYGPNGAPLMGSFEEGGCHSRGPDLDVNQFGDIDNVHFDEIF